MTGEDIRRRRRGIGERGGVWSSASETLLATAQK